MLPKLSIHAAVACGPASLALCELKPGASKSVTGLPSDAIYKQTVGKPPTVWDCINDPTQL
jgi:hypothetical protein